MDYFKASDDDSDDDSFLRELGEHIQEDRQEDPQPSHREQRKGQDEEEEESEKDDDDDSTEDEREWQHGPRRHNSTRSRKKDEEHEYASDDEEEGDCGEEEADEEEEEEDDEDEDDDDEEEEEEEEQEEDDFLEVDEGGRTHLQGRKRPRHCGVEGIKPRQSNKRPEKRFKTSGCSLLSEGTGELLDPDELYPTFDKPLEHGVEEELVLDIVEMEDGEVQKVVVPLAANRYLQEYQKEGVAFLWKHLKANTGCILGDAPGLGKTIQVICLLLAVFRMKGTWADRRDALERRIALDRGEMEPIQRHAVLVVAPASVVAQWHGETERWGHFLVVTLKGRKEGALENIRQAARGGVDVVLCSYDTMKGAYRAALADVKWRAIVFDEFHTVKNDKTNYYKCAKALQSRVKIGLTGTPIQNKLEELWSLLSVVVPREVHDKKSFVAHFANPLKHSNKRTAPVEAKEKGEKRKQELRRLLKHVMLARDKVIISHKLKDKDEHVVFCKLSDIQYTLYERILALPEFELLRELKDVCDCARGESKQVPKGRCCYTAPWRKDGSAARQVDERAVLWKHLHPDGEPCTRCPNCLALPCIAKLQKVANHPSLLQVDESERNRAKREHIKEFARLAFGRELLDAIGGPERSQKFLDLCSAKHCGKLQTLDGLLEKFELEETKVLVFSWSVQTLNILEAFAKSKGYTSRRLDGQTPTSERQHIIDEFNRDKNIFLFFISTKAGGLGLNLTSASRVVIYDVNWNPTQDMQAQDRAFRLGQKKNVKIFRLLSQGTIEEITYMRQIYKQQLRNIAMGPQSDAKEHERVEGTAFDSVQGIKGEEGELFGIQNLLQLTQESILTTLRVKLRLESGVEGQGQEQQQCTEVDYGSLLSEAIRAAVEAKRKHFNIEASADQLFEALGVTSEKTLEQVAPELSTESRLADEEETRVVRAKHYEEDSSVSDGDEGIESRAAAVGDIGVKQLELDDTMVNKKGVAEAHNCAGSVKGSDVTSGSETPGVATPTTTAGPSHHVGIKLRMPKYLPS